MPTIQRVKITLLALLVDNIQEQYSNSHLNVAKFEIKHVSLKFPQLNKVLNILKHLALNF